MFDVFTRSRREAREQGPARISRRGGQEVPSLPLEGPRQRVRCLIRVMDAQDLSLVRRVAAQSGWLERDEAPEARGELGSDALIVDVFVVCARAAALQFAAGQVRQALQGLAATRLEDIALVDTRCEPGQRFVVSWGPPSGWAAPMRTAWTWMGRLGAFTARRELVLPSADVGSASRGSGVGAGVHAVAAASPLNQCVPVDGRRHLHRPLAGAPRELPRSPEQRVIAQVRNAVLALAILTPMLIGAGLTLADYAWLWWVLGVSILVLGVYLGRELTSNSRRSVAFRFGTGALFCLLSAICGMGLGRTVRQALEESNWRPMIMGVLLVIAMPGVAFLLHTRLGRNATRLLVPLVSVGVVITFVSDLSWDLYAYQAFGIPGEVVRRGATSLLLQTLEPTVWALFVVVLLLGCIGWLARYVPAPTPRWLTGTALTALCIVYLLSFAQFGLSRLEPGSTIVIS